MYPASPGVVLDGKFAKSAAELSAVVGSMVPKPGHRKPKDIDRKYIDTCDKSFVELSSVVGSMVPKPSHQKDIDREYMDTFAKSFVELSAFVG